MAQWIIMRSHNDMPLIAETLKALANQSVDHKLLVLENASTDGTKEEVAKWADLVLDVPENSYIPGKVLNQGMAETDGAIAVFLNADATPVDSNWLKNILAGFTHEKIGAVFGCQEPRKNTKPLLIKDMQDTFGDGEKQKKWRHCFSMAASAISRNLWNKMPFKEDLHYSEDIDWTWRARLLGYEIKYLPDAKVWHSNNFDLKGFYKRHMGEGKAEARIFSFDAWQASFLRYSFLPYLRAVASDIKWSFENGYYTEILNSPIWRGAQMLGRRRGFKSP